MTKAIMANDYLDVVLKDDKTETGGTSFMGETLKDFLDELEIDYNTPIGDVNKTLVDCGIQPIMFGEGKKKRSLNEYLQIFESLIQNIRCADDNILKEHFQNCGTLQKTVSSL